MVKIDKLLILNDAQYARNAEYEIFWYVLGTRFERSLQLQITVLLQVFQVAFEVVADLVEDTWKKGQDFGKPHIGAKVNAVVLIQIRSDRCALSR